MLNQPLSQTDIHFWCWIIVMFWALVPLFETNEDKNLALRGNNLFWQIQTSNRILRGGERTVVRKYTWKQEILMETGIIPENGMCSWKQEIHMEIGNTHGKRKFSWIWDVYMKPGNALKEKNNSRKIHIETSKHPPVKDIKRKLSADKKLHFIRDHLKTIPCIRIIICSKFDEEGVFFPRKPN